MKTIINSNGSTWAGKSPKTVKELLKILGENVLDRRFEAYGNFAYRATNKHDKAILGHKTRFFGNFLRLSHVFNIDTDDPTIIKALRRAIRANKCRPDYVLQPKPRGKQ